MTALFDATDWAATPLGPPSGWSQALRTSWSICRRSRFPIILFWGPEFVQLYNAAYAPLVGDKHPRAFGQRSAECFPEVWDQIGPMLRGVLERGDATYSEDLLLPLVRRDGAEECYFTFSYSPVLGAGERTEGVFCAVTETTRTVIGERRLRLLDRLEEALRLALTPRDALDAASEALAASPDIAAYRIVLDERRGGAVVAGGADEPLAIEEPLDDGTATFGTASFAASRLCRLDDDYRGFFRLIAQQIAATVSRLQAFRRLAELDAAKTAFFNNVSHEFRTPLTLILGPLEELEARLLDVADRQTLEIVRRNALRLQKLVNTLLEFSRVESGRTEAAFARTDAAALTAALAGEFRSAFAAAGLALEVRTSGAGAHVRLDAAMYEKIVLNLLSNALKFTFEGGVRVTTAVRGERFVLEVADTGTGIPERDLPHVFERFARVRGARARTHEGSGIGLALVRELVELHGGEIAVESREGEGTTFTVTFPLGAAHLPADRVVDVAPASDAATRRAFVEEARALAGGVRPEAAHDRRDVPSILVADDNDDLRAYLVGLLAPRYRVTAVPDGAALLAAAHRDPPDAIVTDVMMPQLDGIEALRLLRADARTRDVPVLLLSARAGDEATAGGLEAGADDYVVKPFTATTLLARVDALVRRRRRAGAGVAANDAAETRAWRLLASATERFIAHDRPEQVLETLAEIVVPELADWCRVYELRDGRLPLAAVAHGDAAKRDLAWVLDREFPRRVGDWSFVGEIARDRSAVIAPDYDPGSGTRAPDDPRYRELMQALGLRSLIGVPFVVDGELRGVVTALQAESARRFAQRDLELLQRLVQRAASAYAAAATAARERSVASTLQRALLPGTLPRVDGLTFSVSYTPAAADARIGGDWYDAFALPDGRIVASIGDVVGHGLDAAIAMAALRHAIRSHAVEEPSPAAILAHVNRLLLSERAGELATALVLVVDPRSLDVRFAAGGHYGPVVAAPGVAPAFHEASGMLLGVAPDAVFEERRLALAPGSTAILYTDGLIESERDALGGQARLARAIAEHLGVDDLAGTLHRAIYGERRPNDDVAVFTLRASEQLDDFELCVEAAPENAAGLRTAVRRFLAASGFDADRAGELLVAAGEAIANAIEHAYAESGTTGTLTVAGRRGAEELTIEIADAGSWREDRLAGRGFGLPLMHGFADALEVERTAFGTRVIIRARLPGDARPGQRTGAHAFSP